MIPKREKPDPVPPIHPVWEYQATGELARAYEAYREAFQVPWLGMEAMAFAHYRHFFGVWWEAVAPVVGTHVYVKTCEQLLLFVEELVVQLEPPPIAARLRERGYSVHELEEIRATIEIFSHGNFIQLPAVAAAHLLLEGGVLRGTGELRPYAVRHGPPETPQPALIDPHHATADLRALYQEVMDTLGLPFVNPDYRALCRWPSYFELAWRDLRRALLRPEYEAIVSGMHKAMFEATARLPNPKGATALQLQEAATRDARLSEVLDVTRLFTYLLPGLVTNVAFFRAQLETG